ncbi:phosphotransferase [Nocardioides taihuensis]|uniref:Phosphotransferase n=1 Tax=Nocardioides taihuensis TaxID=1835606 RepID=A0ABW0BQP8_9ACTN
MHDRSALGPADVADDVLTGMVADLLGHDAAGVEVLESHAVPVDYDLPAITTASRSWVSGTARTPGGDQSFRMFVKHVQCWSRSPEFRSVPEDFREVAASSVPWRTEPLVYRSDLGDRLPDGLRMPRALGVFDLDALSSSLWLEDVRHPAVAWDLDRYTRAARLLGRLAASERVRPLADVGAFTWSIWQYVHGRVAVDVLPRLPSLTGLPPDLHARLLAAAERVPTVTEELVSLPRLTSHGDACPNNLLAGGDPGSFVLIDYGFWLPNPLAFDLGQLVAGEWQLGRRHTDPLPVVDEACVAAYTAGLAQEGLTLSVADVRRAHALQLFLFVGLSTALDDDHAADRAELVAFSLDLLEATDP